MQRHPTISVPDQGLMDHAWDLLGPWPAVVEGADLLVPVTGHVEFASWDEGTFMLEAAGASALGLGALLPLVRTGAVHRTQAGGGALEWDLSTEDPALTVRAVLWPGELLLIVRRVEDEREVCRARARRTAAYYAAKYP